MSRRIVKHGCEWRESERGYRILGVSVMVYKAVVVLGSAEGRGRGGEGYFLKGVPDRY